MEPLFPDAAAGASSAGVASIRPDSFYGKVLNTAAREYLDMRCAAIALYVMHYNFCRVHEALRITPAMQLGITDHIWPVSNLVAAALDGEIQEKVDMSLATFRVIHGSKA